MDELMLRLNALKHDMPLAEFLKEYFNEKRYDSLTRSVVRFAEGFDVADTTKASSIALRDEWGSDDVENSFRTENGYGVMTDFLADVCKAAGCDIVLNTVVKEINWKQNEATAITSDNTKYTSPQVVVTIPLGLLKAEEHNIAFIKFTPDIKDKREAAKKLGYGGVIKYQLLFKAPFWENKHVGVRQMKELAFLLNDSHVRAWWTELPDKTPMLTGWIGGPQADKLKYKSQQELLDIALDTLAYAFDTTEPALSLPNVAFLQDQIVATQITNWCTDPFSLGAYSYQTVDSKFAQDVLLKPVDNTLFFAGEALAGGKSIGTVEAALESGLLAAFTILKLEEV